MMMMMMMMMNTDIHIDNNNY